MQVHVSACCYVLRQLLSLGAACEGKACCQTVCLCP